MFIKILCGIARTGKSSYAKKLIQDKNTIIISRDKIREMFGDKGNMEHEDYVTSVCQHMLNLSFQNKQNIIIDNTNLKTKYVKPIIDLARKHGYDVEIVRMFLDPESLFKVAIQSNFPVEVISTQMKGHNMFEYELYDVPIVDISVKRYEFDYDLEYYFNRLDFDQHNMHHKETCINHSLSTMQYVENNFYDSKYYDDLLVASKYHDIGKPYAIYKENENYWRYFGHNNISYLIAKNYGLSNLSSVLIALHMDRYSLFNQENIKSYINKLKGYQSYFEKVFNDKDFNFFDLLSKLWIADTMSHGEGMDIRLENLIDKIKKSLDNTTIV